MKWHYPSSSGSGTYTTTLATDGKLVCTCKGWLVRRFGQPRHCTHTRRVVAEQTLRIETRGEFVFAVALASGVSTPPPQVAATSDSRRPPSGGAPTQRDADRAQKAAPMLASAMTTPVTGAAFDQTYGDGEWALEEKLDGHRVIALVTPSGVAAFSRPRAGGTGAKPRELPDCIVAQLRTLAPGIYDGELVVPGGTSSDVVVRGAELVFVVFDLLELDGESLLHASYADRRHLLLGQLRRLSGTQTCVSTVESVPPTWKGVQAIWARGGEGAVLKRRASTYRPGWRSPDWVKVKASHSAVLEVIGFEAGKSGPCSAFQLRERDSGIETTVKVLGNDLLRQVTARPESFIGKRVVITYQQRTASGTFRHPIFDHFAGSGE